ncbi:MAG: DNA repair protein RecN [Kiritimatiellia bacterium]
MLERLTVSNLAIVEKVEAEFAPGLTVITGETGAGKSVLMGALGLVLGDRADASIVRDGAKEAEVEADFGATVVRRTVTAQGRSRAWINDESVSVAELKELGRRLVDIHGPTANQRLLDEDFQRETLDAFGGIGIADYAQAWSALLALRAELAALADAGGAEELDMLRFQVEELEAAGLTEADGTLAERHAAAAHAEEIVESANAVTEALGGDRSAAEILAALQPQFRGMARHFPAAAEWAAEAEELTVRVQELSRAVADAVSKLDAGEEDLQALDARLTLVNRLLRKYRAPDVPSLMSLLSGKRSRLDALAHREERLAELQTQLAAADGAVRAAGAAVTRRRQAAAKRFAQAVTGELRDLGFLQAKFSVVLEAIEPTAHGMDRVVYWFEPNPGEAARPLAAIASSGEIARVMLALKVAASRDSRAEGDPRAARTLVFDEIDANVGGEAGRIVGEKLRAVARHHQVIAITHLPQSAACGERHLVVAKSVAGGRTRTEISAVEGEARVAEVARMLGGEKLTSVVKRHAEELLRLSR